MWSKAADAAFDAIIDDFGSVMRKHAECGPVVVVGALGVIAAVSADVIEDFVTDTYAATDRLESVPPCA